MNPVARDPFEALDEKIRRWIWLRGWKELRDIQGEAICELIVPERDVVISATTASGKTEAAFLPILSRIASTDRPPGGGFSAVYVGPLRTLINDQFERLESLCEDLDIAVTPWHGDVAASVKARALRRPSGVVLITPESLEAMLVRRGGGAAALFAATEYIVVDELHAFLDSARGRQLRSLLARLERLVGRRMVRVGLSATLADLDGACEYLRPGGGATVAQIVSSSGQTIDLAQRGYFVETPIGATENPAIVDEVYRTTRGKRCLVFAGSRGGVETLTDALRQKSARENVPNEYFAHHGNLSRELREDVEHRVKSETLPTTVVCTTTLELGVDIGNIDAIEQIGSGSTVSGMRQRLGRSGRRPGTVANLRVFTREAELDPKNQLDDALRVDTVRSSAMIALMLRKWNEPVVTGRLHLSTLVQQILALVAQHGGITASDAHAALVGSGVFTVPTEIFVATLRRMGHPDVRLLEQSADGLLLPGEVGERVIAARDFYAVFVTGDEYRVVAQGGRLLGTLPIISPYAPGELLIFAGRRWTVTSFDVARKEMLVVRASGGRVPFFEGGDRPSHGEIAREMRRLYLDDTTPAWCDEAAARALREGRETFARLGLAERSVVHVDGICLFTWEDGPVVEALRLMIRRAKIACEVTAGLALRVTISSLDALATLLESIATTAPPSALELARDAKATPTEKYDEYLDDELRAHEYASYAVDPRLVPQVAARLAAELRSDT